MNSDRRGRPDAAEPGLTQQVSRKQTCDRGTASQFVTNMLLGDSDEDD